MQLNMRLGDHAIIEPPRICAQLSFFLRDLLCFVTHFEISLLQIITILISFFPQLQSDKITFSCFSRIEWMNQTPKPSEETLRSHQPSPRDLTARGQYRRMHSFTPEIIVVSMAAEWQITIVYRHFGIAVDSHWKVLVAVRCYLYYSIQKQKGSRLVIDCLCVTEVNYCVQAN